MLTIKVGNSQELTSLRISGFDYNKAVLCYSHVESLKFNGASVADSANQGRKVQTNEVGHPDRLWFPLEEV